MITDLVSKASNGECPFLVAVNGTKIYSNFSYKIYENGALIPHWRFDESTDCTIEVIHPCGEVISVLSGDDSKKFLLDCKKIEKSFHGYAPNYQAVCRAYDGYMEKYNSHNQKVNLYL